MDDFKNTTRMKIMGKQSGGRVSAPVVPVTRRTDEPNVSVGGVGGGYGPSYGGATGSAMRAGDAAARFASSGTLAAPRGPARGVGLNVRIPLKKGGEAKAAACGGPMKKAMGGAALSGSPQPQMSQTQMMEAARNTSQPQSAPKPQSGVSSQQLATKKPAPGGLLSQVVNPSKTMPKQLSGIGSSLGGIGRTPGFQNPSNMMMGQKTPASSTPSKSPALTIQRATDAMRAKQAATQQQKKLADPRRQENTERLRGAPGKGMPQPINQKPKAATLPRGVTKRPGGGYQDRMGMPLVDNSMSAGMASRIGEGRSTDPRLLKKGGLAAMPKGKC